MNQRPKHAYIYIYIYKEAYWKQEKRSIKEVVINLIIDCAGRSTKSTLNLAQKVRN
jgi:hypothetical protein